MEYVWMRAGMSRVGVRDGVVALDGEMLSGELPIKQRRILDGWMALHEEEAYAAWNLAVQGKPFEKIVPAM